MGRAEITPRAHSGPSPAFPVSRLLERKGSWQRSSLTCRAAERATRAASQFYALRPRTALLHTSLALATLCNIAALIFCCKNWLGMRHRPQLIVNVSQTSSQPSFHGLRDQGFDHQNNQRHDKRSSSAQDRPSDSKKSYLLRDS